MTWLAFEHVHQPSRPGEAQRTGWLSPGYIGLESDGTIARVSAEPPEGFSASPTPGFAVPGMPNLHSHAFQRALVGRAERSGPGTEDSFWTWRTLMYQLAHAIQPDQLEVVAAQLYIEMLEAGMTSVGEFHYLHHAPDGALYDDHAEMSLRIMAAAHRANIGLTHLPVLYMQGGFDRPAESHQRRFVHDEVDHFVDLVARLQSEALKSALFRVGIAPHSLRAVDASSLARAVQNVQGLDASAPIHIHIAEQQREVDECIAARGARPVEWLLDYHQVDLRWCLVHATHLDDAEIERFAKSGAIAGLCPTTEANLGDGVFPADRHLAQSGALGIGTDSHVGVDPAEELRALEYSQRLRDQKRNVLADGPECSVARSLFDAALEGGALALHQPVGALTPGRRADIVVLDGQHPRLLGHGPDTILDAWVFGAAAGAVRDVYVAGQRVVESGRHIERDGVRAAFGEVMRELW